MCYAALTKGTTAIATELLVAARKLGVYDTLVAELRDSQAAQAKRMGDAVPAMPGKAHRWVAEMEEIARTFEDVGLTPLMFQGAAEMYRLTARSEIGGERPGDRRSFPRRGRDGRRIGAREREGADEVNDFFAKLKRLFEPPRDPRRTLANRPLTDRHRALRNPPLRRNRLLLLKPRNRLLWNRLAWQPRNRCTRSHHSPVEAPPSRAPASLHEDDLAEVRAALEAVAEGPVTVEPEPQTRATGRATAGIRVRDLALPDTFSTADRGDRRSSCPSQRRTSAMRSSSR